MIAIINRIQTCMRTYEESFWRTSAQSACAAFGPRMALGKSNFVGQEAGGAWQGMPELGPETGPRESTDTKQLPEKLLLTQALLGVSYLSCLALQEFHARSWFRQMSSRDTPTDSASSGPPVGLGSGTTISTG